MAKEYTEDLHEVYRILRRKVKGPCTRRESDFDVDDALRVVYFPA
jgi:hypothetical protein